MFQNDQLSTTMMSTHSSLEPKARSWSHQQIPLATTALFFL